MQSKITLAISVAALCIVSGSAKSQSCLSWNSYTGVWDYVYCGAYATNKVAPYVLNRVVPGGGYAYRGGNYIGDYIVTHPVQPRVWNPPPYRSPYSYTPPALPRQIQRYAPYYPNYR